MDIKLPLEWQYLPTLHSNKLTLMGETEVAS